jgi:hypothetical protein
MAVVRLQVKLPATNQLMELFFEPVFHLRFPSKVRCDSGQRFLVELESPKSFYSPVVYARAILGVNNYRIGISA